MKKFLLLTAATLSAALCHADYRALVFQNGKPVSQTKVQNISKIALANKNYVQTSEDGNKSFAIGSIDSLVFVKDTVHIKYDGGNVVVNNPLASAGLNIIEGEGIVQVLPDTSVFDLKDVVFVLSGNGTGGFRMKQSKRVNLVLDNLQLAGVMGSPIAMTGDKGVSIKLVGSNILSVKNAIDSIPNAALVVNDKLTIEGLGDLTLSGDYKNGIEVKDDLVINEASILVSAKKTGVRVKDNLVLNSGSLAVSANGDGVDVNDTIFVNGGKLVSTASGSDVKAVSSDAAYIQTGGDVSVVVNGNGSKGIKVGSVTDDNNQVVRAGNMFVSGGTLTAEIVGAGKYTDPNDSENSSSPAALKADGNVDITGGTVNVSANVASSAARGIAADGTIYIHGTSKVKVDIQSYKGKAWCFKSDNAVEVKEGCLTTDFNWDNSKSDDNEAGIFSSSKKTIAE
ncbi:MAG: carbohydrate-binding domain-containing protein [Paludibacteraceae bacterium]|nr:carbohydrate-binding domain-containing protein [Paludibacteraceae bacterium]